MPNEDTCRKKAETLLRAAAMTDNMKVRSQLIDEAARWHWAAVEARDRSARANDDVRMPAWSKSG